MESCDNLIGTYVSEYELKLIAECAKIEKVSPIEWACRIAADIACRVYLRKQQADR